MLRVTATLTCLAMLCAPAAARASSDAPGNGYQRTIDTGIEPVEVQLSYADAGPGSAALAGEGSIRLGLPGAGRLTLRVPHVVGASASLGNTQLAASFALATERALLPSVGLFAAVDLPTSPGTRAAHTAVKALAEKRLESGPLEAIHLESEVWGDGPQLLQGYRAALGTTGALDLATHYSVEIIALRSRVGGESIRESLVQVGVSHRFGGGIGFNAGVAAWIAGDANSVRATLGLERRF